MAPDQSPRPVRLSVADPQLRERLGELFRGARLDVEFVDDEAVSGEADVSLVSGDEVAGTGGSELGAEEDPSVIVVGGDARPVDEARLVAAGALAVLDEDDTDARLRQQIVELAQAEIEGGLDGPEASGSQAEPRLADFQSRSPRMREFLALVHRIADTDSTLLVTGETGVGKERLARAIHAESPRAAAPFVTVNCGGLPETLLESELFGHEKGAFTGAGAARRGRFEEANGGTLFLDEIGEMPQHLQVKLLTVLQRREIRPLGASEPRRVDVRVVSATNRNLAEDVREGRFRDDLLFRLNVVQLEIPPLRERREDLPQLLGRFLRHFREVHERPELHGFERDALRALLEYGWPGNVREAVNVIERAALLAPGELVALKDLPDSVRGGAPAVGTAARGVAGGREVASSAGAAANDTLLDLPLHDARRKLVEEFEARYLRHHLERTRGAVGETASSAGVNPRTLYEKLKRYGIDRREFR